MFNAITRTWKGLGDTAKIFLVCFTFYLVCRIFKH